MARKPEGKGPGLPGEVGSLKRGSSLSRLADSGVQKAQAGVRGQGELEGLGFRKMAGGEEDEGMGGEQGPEDWRQDRACW